MTAEGQEMAVRVRVVAAAQVLVLLGSLIAAVYVSQPSDWEPLWLPGALLGLAIISDALAIELRSMRISVSFSVLVVAMVLLGPAPAVAVSLLAVIVDAGRNKLEPRKWLDNLSTFAAFPLLGGMLAVAIDPGDDVFAVVGVVLLVFLVTVILNFTLIWLAHAIRGRNGILDGYREIFLPTLPAQAAAAVLTALLAAVALETGLWAVGVLGGLVLIFQYLLRYARDAKGRADELAERNRQLASLHVGLISTTLKTLALRDHMTARHSAAVARYARAVAEDLGLDERDQDVIHTAALFHDVGKFIFPDHVLLAHGELSASDHAMIRRHPAVGADLVAEIEGYGPVAEIVRAHHERIDGEGYPDGIAGDEIPLGSRIIAVADVYDVITARDTYRTPISSDEAFEELRRVAGTQLDPQIVAIFIRLIQRRGMRFRHSTAQDFELELGLQHRVDAHAAPLKVS